MPGNWYDSIQKKRKEGFEEKDMREVFAEKPKEKKSPWKTALGMTALILLLILGTIYLCGAFYFRDKFFTGTAINSIDASYRTVDEVERQVAYQVEQYRLLVTQRGGYEDQIQAADIEYNYTSTGEIEGFKKEQNPFLWPMLFFKVFDYRFDSSAVYDLGKLQEAIDGLTCLDPEVVEEPQNAEVVFNGITYEMKKEQQGRKIDREKLEKAVRTAIESGKNVVDLEKEDCYEKPEITSENAVLKKKFERLYLYTKAKIEYTFGDETEILDGSVINNWLSWDEEGVVTLNEDGVVEYVAALAEKYDTYNKNRYFETHDGSYVDVPSGTYGWKIDQEAEVEQILEIVKDGRQAERWPVYSQTASTRENCDMGDSYVEIDLTNQTLWMYKDGEVIVESQFVSGDVAKGHTTPGGVYALYWKKSPSVLKSDTPGDSYETPVTYWMPFNGGIGLHDATW